MRRRTVLAGGAGALAGAVAAPPAFAQSLDAAAAVEAAFIAGFPAFEVLRTGYVNAAPNPNRPDWAFNTVLHRRNLTDPTSRVVTAPNNDVLASSIRINLAAGPLLLTIPDMPDRYLSVQFMDAFTDTFAMVGTRATGGRGGRFLLTPPGWRGRAPEGVVRMRAPSLDVWVLARTLIAGPEELPVVRALQDRFAVTTLAGEAPNTGPPLPLAPTSASDPENFLPVVNAVLARVPRGDARARRALQAGGRVGVRRGDVAAWGSLAPATQSAWRTGAAAVLAALKAESTRLERIVDGWSYTTEAVGRFGADDRLRAMIALSWLAALPSEETMYAFTAVDADGARLSGDQAYRLELPAGGPPVDAFWSVTVYQEEPDGRLFLTENPIGRHSIGDRTRGLRRGPDGSLTLHFQRTPPADPDVAANWLPLPAGPWRALFRAYLPRPALRSLTWRLPPLRRA